ncbi:hypothetical protein KTAU_43600 [Thermogemmatispora aurantia]|uniref:Protein-glutamine gamma-glutamyltransferase-like C-terminal domain-containing protein n=1 Tax=Thermogemmatispora aurantia TaxID=2045279 RepID=A0A5J4KKF2_9CHLR|nr:hypothetical protein KTAU_43600 [Thermogemmatispora aurantia]
MRSSGAGSEYEARGAREKGVRYKDPLNGEPELPDDLLVRIVLAERRRRERLSQSTAYLPGVRTAGERLVAYLCLALEVCALAAWLQVLAELHLFMSAQPLLPLWVLFPLGALALWLTRLWEQRLVRHTPPLDEFDRPGEPLPGRSLIVGLLIASALCLCWLNNYAAAFPLYHPAWLLALGNDLLALRPAAYRSVAILLCTALLVWRGAKRARQEAEPALVRWAFIGSGLLLLLAMLIHLGHGSDTDQSLVNAGTVVFFLLIPLFIYCALLAQALAQAIAERRLHPFGLEGSMQEQERAILLLFLGLGLLMVLLSLAVAALAGASLFEVLRRGLAFLSMPYDWLVRGLAQLIVWLLTPLFWLLQAFHFQTSEPIIYPLRGPGLPGLRPPGESTSLPAGLLLASRILVLLILVLIVVGCLRLIGRTLRQRRVRLYERGELEERHESLWSTALFWSQIWEVLQILARKLRDALVHGRQAVEARKLLRRGTRQEAVRSLESMRAIYRALLKEARQQGYPRLPNETPLEYRRRLEAATPLADPHLEWLTVAYLASRYGRQEPDATRLAQLRAGWQELRNRWHRR